MKYLFALFITMTTPIMIFAHGPATSDTSYGMHDMIEYGHHGIMGLLGWMFMLSVWTLILLAIIALIIWITKNSKK